MPKPKSKENAIKLLSQNVAPTEVAKQTGYSISRIYDFKKELDNAPEQPPPEATDIAPLQSPRIADIEAKLDKALDTLLEHLEREVTSDIIEGIVKVTETIGKLRTSTVNIAELINENPPNQERTPIRPEDNAREDPPATSPDAENFVTILERTSRGAKETD